MVNKSAFIYFILICSTLLFACKTKQPIQPMESYKEIEPNYSTVNVPINLSLSALERTVNEQMGEVIYEDNDNSDDMMIKATRTEEVKIGLGDGSFIYNLPIDIEVTRKTALGSVSGSGVLKMYFQTKYDISKDWKLVTETTVEKHEWFEKPVLKMGFVKVPVQFLADQILQRSSEIITTQIDEQMNKGVDLQKMVEMVWQQVQDPILMDAENNAWIKITPKDIALAPLVTKNDTIHTTVFLNALSEITLGEKPEYEKIDDLPSFEFRKNKKDDFTVNLSTSIDYDELERLAKGFVVGQTYESGKQSVTVEDLFLYGRDEKIVVKTRLSGSYSGSVFMEGVPHFDPKSNTISVKELEFELATKNVLHKSAAWLFKKGIVSQVEKSLQFPLTENINDIKKMAAEKLENFEVAKGIFLQGSLEDITVDKTYLTPEGIQILVASKGKLNVNIDDIVMGEQTTIE